jgi:abortive infection bacteriophage resistance protein
VHVHAFTQDLSNFEAEWRKSLRKPYSLDSDGFQDLVNATNSLRNLHHDADNIEIMYKFVCRVKMRVYLKGFR